MKLENVITAELMASNRLPDGAWEVKRTVSNSLAFSAFSDHQINRLLKVRKQTFHYKIQDVGKSRKPFDGFTMTKQPAWCVCCYPSNTPPGYTAYAIDILVWYDERRICGRKSLIEARAKELGIMI